MSLFGDIAGTAQRQQQIGLGAATSAAGAAMGAGAAALKAGAAGKRYDRLAGVPDQWLATPGANQQSYFDSLLNYWGAAQGISEKTAQAEQNQALALREQAIPGLNAGIQKAAPSIFDMLQGKLTPEQIRSAQLVGGANSVGTGFGGSEYGKFNTSRYGALSSEAVMQQGWGLLGAMMSTLPKISSPSAATWLTRGVMTPEQLTGLQVQQRGQNIGVEGQLANMPLSGDIWGDYLGGMGSTAYGAGLSALLGVAAGNYAPYGQYGGYGVPANNSGSPYGNPTPGYQGYQNGAAYYDVPVTYNTYNG